MLVFCMYHNQKQSCINFKSGYSQKWQITPKIAIKDSILIVV